MLTLLEGAQECLEIVWSGFEDFLVEFGVDGEHVALHLLDVSGHVFVFHDHLFSSLIRRSHYPLGLLIEALELLVVYVSIGLLRLDLFILIVENFMHLLSIYLILFAIELLHFSLFLVQRFLSLLEILQLLIELVKILI